MLTARVISLIIGHIFGLFPTGLICGKIAHTDLKSQGSGNTGMTNTVRVLGWKAGLLVFAGDCAKAVVAMVLVWCFYHEQWPLLVKLFELYAGLGAVLGHNYPFYRKFKGGKGIASSVGVVCTYDWRMIPICAVLFFAAVIPTKFMSLGSLGIVSGFLVQTIVFGQLGILKIGAGHLAETYIISAIFTFTAFWQHRANIGRLMHGTENTFTPGKKS